MAQQGNKKAQKRQTRARRQAEEEARQKALAEAAAKERKQQTIIGAIVVAVIIILVAVIAVISLRSIHKKNEANKVTADASYSALQKVKTKPKYADDKGGILISKDGYNKKIAKVPTVEIYMDPLCPGCGSLHRQIDTDLDKLVNSGQINLVYHPMNFLDADSTDQYSTRAAGALLYVSSHDPDAQHLLDFVSNLYKEGYQPGEGPEYKPTSNAQIRAQAISAGVSRDVMSKAFDGTYNKWLKASYDYTVRRKDLLNSSGQMSTPAVTINGKLMDMSEISQLGITQKQALLKQLGIKESQVGEEGVRPKIGTGAPEPLN
ncbi:thioredoxin domain-containing protein [Bifidobacterium sp. ESL0784]|uniref:DsbA family protein n=1 Tax=Bifidobacterium sp. ESL0784 TaxID=2983231 RepID=UPI0023F97C51|nr:thioredoxin domain-containing protein [Bifidobacterium sp. ESL0784]MDF7640084.1 thioredoxin domain-containing protein [Bifidobacterium sp. ESL0784]